MARNAVAKKKGSAARNLQRMDVKRNSQKSENKPKLKPSFILTFAEKAIKLKHSSSFVIGAPVVMDAMKGKFWHEQTQIIKNWIAGKTEQTQIIKKIASPKILNRYAIYRLIAIIGQRRMSHNDGD